MSQTFLPKILVQKAREVAQMTVEEVGTLRSTYSLYEFLKKHSKRVQIISEVKKASPSLGDINLAVNIVDQAKIYENAGVAMISVLTDSSFFKGDIADLREISRNVTIPTLAKDFIIDEKQIIRSRNAGAMVILLIVAALSKERLSQLYHYARSLGLEVLVETHNETELALAHELGAQLIGVNNRDLVTFDVTIETTKHMARDFKTDPVYISESGFFTPQDVAQVAPFVQAVLVGTALMTSGDVARTLRELQIDKG